MQLGAFSMSLSVKDLKLSMEFYENLGFKMFGGDTNIGYVIMKNGNALIGLFQGMFEKNIITFNPGWDENAAEVKPFDDVRKIQEFLLSKGVHIEIKIPEGGSGPANIIVTDPDGNTILIDQHV